MTDRRPRISLVGCGSAKRDDPSPARDLYTSGYFSKKREYAEELADRWYVLSAEHGILLPDSTIDPYDTSIDDLDQEELESWSSTVIETISLLEDDAIEIDLLAGRGYIEPIRDGLDDLGHDVNEPFAETSGIGEQLALLGNRIEC